MAARSFDLTTFPDEALTAIFTLPRLKDIFPRALRGEGWSEEDAFETLVRELTIKCAEGTLAEALTGLRCLYGDL